MYGLRPTHTIFALVGIRLLGPPNGLLSWFNSSLDFLRLTKAKKSPMKEDDFLGVVLCTAVLPKS
jgi:hypothetical protein